MSTQEKILSGAVFFTAGLAIGSLVMWITYH